MTKNKTRNGQDQDEGSRMRVICRSSTVDDDNNIQTVREGTAELRGKSRRVERVKITNHCIPEPGPVCKYGTIILLCFRKLLQFQTVVIHFRCIYLRHISTQKGRRFWRVLRDTSMKLGGRHKKETSG